MATHCIALHPKGTIRVTSIPASAADETIPTPKLASAVLKRATPPEKIGEWVWKDHIIHIYGYKSGKSGTENKHELPPPHDAITLYGEIALFATKNGILHSFDSATYQKFYNESTGAQDADDDSDDDDEIDEDDEDLEDELEDDISNDDSDSEPEPDIESEDEAPIKRRAKAVKKGAKKIAVWYSHTELTHEHDKESDDITVYNAKRSSALSIISARCAGLTEDEQQDLERGIYNASINEANKRGTRSVWDNPEFAIIYDIILKRVVTNLDKSSYVGNERLYERLRDGEFKPRDIPMMGYSELFPEKWVGLSEMAIKREAKMLEVDKSMATDMFKCSRCHKRQCTYYEMQTRSADEPMTQFIRCLNCGKQWRQ